MYNNTLEKRFTEIKQILEKARTSTTIPKGTTLVKRDKGETIPKGVASKQMSGGATYVPKRATSTKTAGKIPVYWQGGGKGFPIRYINPETPMPKGYGPSPRIKIQEEKEKKISKPEAIAQKETPVASINTQANDIKEKRVKLDTTKQETYEDMISYLRNAYNKTKDKLTAEKDKEKATELAITAGILLTVHDNLLQNRDKVSLSTESIRIQFDSLNPRELNSIQLREYANVGLEKLDEGEEVNSNKLIYAINTIKKEDKLLEERKVSQLNKRFDEDLKNIATGISVVADKNLRYNKKKYIGIPSLSEKEEQKDFLDSLGNYSDSEKKEMLHIKYNLLSSIVKKDDKDKVEINVIQSTMTIDNKYTETIESITEKLKDKYRDLFEYAVTVQDTGEKTSFTIIRHVQGIAGLTESVADSLGLYPCIIPPGGSIRKLVQDIREQSLEMKQRQNKVLPFRIIASNKIEVLDPSSEKNNVVIVEGKSGSGKTSLLLSNLINAAYNDTKQTRQLTMIDFSRKLWATSQMKELKDILIKKNLLHDPLSEFDKMDIIQGKDLKAYVDTYYTHYIKTIATQSNLLKQSNTNRIEATKDAIPIQDIYIDEFKGLIDKIKEDNYLTDSEKKECIRKVDSTLNRTQTEGKKHGIYLTLLSQSGVEEPSIKDTFRTINKDVILFNPANDPYAYDKFPTGHNLLKHVMERNTNSIAYLPNGSVPLIGEGVKRKVLASAVNKKTEYVGNKNLTQILENVKTTE